MTKFYIKTLLNFLLVLCGLFLPGLASALPTGDPIPPDTIAQRGHCSTVIVADTLCATNEIRLSAFVQWTFTGLMTPMTVVWSTGETAHKINVEPPGNWSWDPSGTSCEIWHQQNGISFDKTFFDGPVEITGPTAICPNETGLELTLNISGYDDFTSVVWTPGSPTGDVDPYPILHGGTYKITVEDAYGCTSSDQIKIDEIPDFTPAITGDNRMCPEGDTATLTIVNPNLYMGFEWSTGETESPITITEPGSYMVTATDTHGCTGVGTFGVQSGGVELFSISQTSLGLCPGQTDTLRVVGGFAQYNWSNNVTGITNIVQQAGTYTVTVTNSYGCTGTSTAVVTPLTPPVVMVTQTLLCPGDSAIIQVNGVFPQYHWSSGQTSQSIAATLPGTYSVTVSGAGICAANTSTMLDFAAAPSVNIDPPATFNCVITQTTLDGSNSSNGPNFPFSWSTLGGHFLSGQNTLNPTVDEPGLYILQVTDLTTGCVTIDTTQVTEYISYPPAFAGPPATLTCAIQHFDIGPLPAPSDPLLLPAWSTTNGNIVSGNDTWSPDVSEPGTYTLTVTNATNGCTNSDSVVIGEDLTPPIATIAPHDLITCFQGAVVLDGTGSSNGPDFTYNWSTPAGFIIGPTNSGTVIAASIGTYNLLITNTLTGCTATTSTTVAADTNIPMVSAATPTPLTCWGGTTLIDASGSSSGPTYQYTWTTQNGHVVFGGNTLTPTVDAPGIYTLNLLNTANNCNATLAVVVSENITPPVANAGQDGILTCNLSATQLDGSASSSGVNFTYQWTTSDGSIQSGDNTVNPTVNQAGTYTLLVTDVVNGCTDTASVLILNDANTPQAIIAAASQLTCTNQQTILDASASSQSGTLSYVWSGDPLASGQGTLQPVVNQPGVYVLNITNLGNGCTATAAVTVTQDVAAPVADAGPAQLLNCYNPTSVIGNAGNPFGAGFQLQWTTTGGGFASPVNGPTAVANQPGNYQLLVTNLQNGCTATDNVIVTANFTPPVANAGAGSELNCIQTSLALQGSGSTGAAFTYLWSTPTGNIASGANGLNPIVTEPGIYNLLVTNTVNGCTASSQVVITENANGPMASAGQAQTLTCILTNTTLSATGSSTGPNFSYSWSTPNGNITSGANTFSPAIDAPGTYVVTVTNSSNLCTQTASVTILENIQAPQVNAGLDNTLTCAITSMAMQAVVVSSSSVNIGYNWNTPDGQIVIGGTSASPVINAPGTYSVTVTDAANGCTGTDQVLISEDVAPPTALIANPGTITCSVPQVTLNTSGSSTGQNFSYYWTTPSGHFFSQQNPQQPIVDGAGVYQLLLTNNTNGCTQTASVTVAQNIQLPTVEAGAAPGLDCDTPSNTLNAAGSDQGAGFVYTWSTTDGHIVSGANTMMPVVNEPGLYTLTILNTQNGCSSTDQVTVAEDVQHPELAIAAPEILTCTVTAVTLNASGSGMGSGPNIVWATSNGHFVVGGSFMLAIVDEPGTYTLTVQNTGNGCTTAVPVTVTENIQMPSVQIQSPPLLTCSVLEFPLHGTVPAQVGINWSTTNGHIVSGADSANPVVDQPGIYLLAVSSLLNGCTNSAQVTVQQELNVPTGLAFTLTPPHCNGTPGAIAVDQVDGGIGPFAYSIDGGQTFFPATAFSDITPGAYDLVIQDVNGCEISEVVQVPEPPNPTVSLPPVFNIELGETQQLLAQIPAQYPLSVIDTVVWTPMDGLTFAGNSIPQLLSPVAQPFRSTDYKVTIYTKEGCSSEARTRLKVDREVDIYVPNVIWPEEPDGENGVFLVFARDASVAVIKKLQIFDRWGTLVFENTGFFPNDPAAGWKGDYRGLPVNPAVYVWWMEATLVDGRALLLKGDVTVVR